MPKKHELKFERRRIWSVWIQQHMVFIKGQLMFRNAGTARSGGGFDVATIEAVWRKGTLETNYPGFRKDICGASMSRGRYGDRSSQFGWEIDHIKPVAKGGTDDISNLQPLQWENNVHKGDDYPHWYCKVKN